MWRYWLALAGVNGALAVALGAAGAHAFAATPEAERLFADFVRIKNAKTRTIQGTGLGLSTVKKIATLYDGNAGVTSVPGEGSTFWVTLNSPVLTQEPLHAS